MPGQRLDTALVRRGLARSRTQAAQLIATRRVTIAGRTVCKAATSVTDAIPVTVLPGDDYASRGAHKLLGALDSFNLDAQGRRALDAGASTGGFTDVLLRGGARSVAAVDVGHRQLDPRLAADPRVSVHDGINLRSLTVDQVNSILTALGGPPDLIVVDVSFISLTLVLPQLAALADPAADLVPMVKPQFEVGRQRLGAGGVVRSAALRAAAVKQVAQAAGALGWHPAAAVGSPLPGPSGNVEYFLHLRADHAADPPRTAAMIETAVAGGPQ